RASPSRNSNREVVDNHFLRGGDEMKQLELSFRSRKALTVHVGEAAATEIIEFLVRLAERVEQLDRGKVDIMEIVPTAPARRNTLRKAA
ncbi:MAG: hypothetical protein O3C40_34995, partial [Planctomycetota bacterium]|nr:hypothetical protein [Planctomycetota bacterium]